MSRYGYRPTTKYRSRKITIDGIEFDSTKEARRYDELKALERAGVIEDLQLQVKYDLIPSQRIDGRVVELPCTYTADFVYKENGKTVVEDTKSPATRTPVYVVKRKLMLWLHGIRISER